MGVFYQPYNLENMGAGLDRFHSLDRIPEGMCSELQNLDPLSNDQWRTRKGYERYYGSLPLRATTVSKTGTGYKIEFDDAVNIDLSTVGLGPVTVSGSLPQIDAPDIWPGYTGDFTDSFSTHYYDSYSLTFREAFVAGDNLTKTKTATQTGLNQPYAFIGLHSADSTTTNQSTVLVPEQVQIDKSDFQVEMSYTAQSDFVGYFTFLPTPAKAGVTHISTVSAQTSVNILSATHGLNTTNFIVRCYTDNGTDLFESTPSTMSINSSGDLNVTFDDAFTGAIIIYAVTSDFAQTKPAIGGSQVLTFTGITDPFNHYEFWITVGSERICVVPESIEWNNDILSVGYVGPSVENVDLFRVPALYLANSIEITDTNAVSETFTTNNPEIVVWGLGHEGIYKPSAVRGGHTHHLDNYKSETSDFMVTALGGNLMRASSFDSFGTTYKMPSLSVRGSNRTSGAMTLAPLFANDSITYTRSRGNVTDASIDTEGYARVSQIVPAGAYTDYTLEFTNKTGTVAVGSTSGFTVDTHDKLTLRNCTRDVNNGSFQISSIVSDSTTETVIRCVNSTSKAESGIFAQANVFTDRILLTGTPVFHVGDKLSSIVLNNNQVMATTQANTIFVDSVIAATELGDGINLYVTRTSSVLPLQDIPIETVGEDTNGGMVRGDSVRVTGINRRPRVKRVNTNATQSVSVVVSLGVGTISMASHNLNEGQLINLYAGASASVVGQFSITVVDSGTFTILVPNAADATYTATFEGKTVEIDESLPITTGPSIVAVTVDGRWTPVEIPKTSSVRPTSTKRQTWDESEATDQPYLRSVIVGDSLVLANGIDETKKFDGVNITNAGLVPFQGVAYLSVDTSTKALTAGQAIPYTSKDVTKKYFTISAPIMSIGQRFRSSDGNIYTVSSVEVDSVGATLVYIVEDMSAVESATGSLTLSSSYRYYIRYNAVDRNRNIVASAALGADDLYAEIFESSAINIKALGFPAFEEIDHDRIEIEIYRTKRNTTGLFYRVYRGRIDYSANAGYVNYLDTKVDDQLGDAQTDTPMSGLLGKNLGNTWANPPRAKATTTVSDRLVLANITSPPTMDLAFYRKSQDLVTSDFSLGEITLKKFDVESGKENANNSMVLSFEAEAQKETLIASQASIAQKGYIKSFEDLNVTYFSNTINIAGHGFTTGQKVVLGADGNEVPTGLVKGSTYYVYRVDIDKFKLCATLVHSIAGTAIVISASASGTGTFTVFVNTAHIVYNDSNISSSSAIAGSWIYLFDSKAKTSVSFLDGVVNYTTDIVTKADHGFINGQKVILSSSGDEVPVGLGAGSTYYIHVIDDDTFKICSTRALAFAGTAIGISASASTDDTFTLTELEEYVLDFAGYYRISEVSGDYVIIDTKHSRAQGLMGSTDPDSYVLSQSNTLSAPLRIPVYMDTDGNFNQVFANSADHETRASTRLAIAINSAMSVDPSDNAYWVGLDSKPSPWLIAQAGLSFNTGSVKIQLVDDPSGGITINRSNNFTNMDIYVNDLIASGTERSEIRQFNSRLVTSYPNFPEIFDDSFNQSGIGDGIIDVNPADGQDITAVIPFFGQSSFGNANLAQSVVVFKTSSIYLVNVLNGDKNKLHSQGQGCTAPRSVTVTKDGIIFANESGIYKLGWDMKVSWVGRMINELWKEEIDLSKIAEFCGHNYKQGRKYKLGVVPLGGTFPSETVNYDHSREELGQMGAWNEYTNHNVTGWANQAIDAYYGNTTGLVYKIRNNSNLTDYRDDDQPIAQQLATTGGISYGLPANRKTTSAAIIQYQTPSSDIIVSTEQSLSGTFVDSANVDISNENSTVRYSLAERKGNFLRIKVIKSGVKDESMEISRITLQVKDLGSLGVKQASETK